MRMHAKAARPWGVSAERRREVARALALVTGEARGSIRPGLLKMRGERGESMDKCSQSLSPFQKAIVGLAGIAGAVVLVTGAVTRDYGVTQVGLTVVSLTIAVAVFKRYRALP